MAPDPETAATGSTASTAATGDTGEAVVRDPCEGTVACWRFEVALGGETPDFSTNGHDLTLSGNLTLTDDVPPTGGDNLRAMLFNGKPDALTYPLKGTSLETFSAGLTAELWLRPDQLPIPVDSVGGRIHYALWSNDDVIGVVLVSDPQGTETNLRVVLNASGGGAGACTVQATVPWTKAEGEWACVSASYANEQLLVYLDGVLQATANAPAGCGSAVGPSDLFHIGIDETLNLNGLWERGFTGAIDEVRFTEGAVPADALFCAPPPGATP